MSVSFEARLAARGFDIALDVMEGETLAVLGPNGAGKSTLLGMLAGLVRPDSGRAQLDDRVLFNMQPQVGAWLPPHRRGVALLAQEPLLFPHLNVRANVAFGPRSAGASRDEASARAQHWMGETETLPLAARRPGELSGGQAQRVAIARALATEPRLLLLDEPLSALDVEVAPMIRRMLRRVIADQTTILVTHDVLDAFLLADRVAIVKDGHVVEQGPTRDVLERPRNAFTAELAGVSLLTGWRTGSGLVTDHGVEIVANAHADAHSDSDSDANVVADANVSDAGRRTPDTDRNASPDDRRRVTAALRPSAVRVDRGATPSGVVNAVAATVRDLEPHGDLVRVRTDWLTADIAPSRVADLDLAPGTPVTLAFSPADVVLYPA